MRPPRINRWENYREKERESEKKVPGTEGGRESRDGLAYSPQTRHRAIQIEEEKQGKLRVTEDRYSVANLSYIAVLFPYPSVKSLF
jgi:hypothetical protein